MPLLNPGGQTAAQVQALIDAGYPVSIPHGGTGATTAIGGFDALSAHGANKAAASTVDLDSATGQILFITGGSTINSFTLADGKMRLVAFTSSGTITHSPSGIVCPGGANIPRANGDWALLSGGSGGIVYVVFYQRSNGSSLTGASQADITAALAVITGPAITQTGHGLAIGDVVRMDGANYVAAQADSGANAEVVGIVSLVPDADTFSLKTFGFVSGLAGLTAGATYFLDPVTAGALTATEPTTDGQISKPVFIAVSTTAGYFFNMRGAEVGAGAASGGVIAGASFDTSSGFITNLVSEGVISTVGYAGVGNYTVGFASDQPDDRYSVSVELLFTDTQITSWGISGRGLSGFSIQVNQTVNAGGGLVGSPVAIDLDGIVVTVMRLSQ